MTYPFSLQSRENFIFKDEKGKTVSNLQPYYKIELQIKQAIDEFMDGTGINRVAGYEQSILRGWVSYSRMNLQILLLAYLIVDSITNLSKFREVREYNICLDYLTSRYSDIKNVSKLETEIYIYCLKVKNIKTKVER